MSNARRVNWLALGLVLVALFALDRQLGPRSGKGSEYGLLENQTKRLVTKPKAKVLILGQSTTGQWLTPSNLGHLLGIPASKILDGHLSGCQPDCTYAEVRRLLAEKRHFKEAFFGVNLYTLCEGESRRRVASEVVTLPLADTFTLANHYWNTEEPTRYFGALAALSVSKAYLDPDFVQRQLFGAWIDPKAHSDYWMDQGIVDQLALGRRPQRLNRPTRDRSCALEDDEIAFKMSIIESLLTDLEQLSDRTFLMALPDRSLVKTSKDPETARRWTKFVELMRKVTSTHPKVTFLDVASPGPRMRSQYRDSFHLTGTGMVHQNRVLVRLLQKVRPVKARPYEARLSKRRAKARSSKFRAAKARASKARAKARSEDR